MLKKNNQTIGTIYKGLTPIEKIYKGGILVWEGWKKLIKYGIPPLTLTKCKDNNLLNYQIYGNSKQGRLPEGYTELEYIESTGTQYIDTGFIPTANTKVSADFKSNKVSGDPFTSVFGTQKSVNDGRFYCLFGSQNNVQINFPSSKTQFIGLNEDGTYTTTSVGNFWTNDRTEYIMDISSKTVQIGNITWDSSSYFTDFISSEYNLFLLTRNSSGTADANCSKGLLYGAKIYQNNVLVRNLIPCKTNQGEVGMYDLVNNVFYENAGTGTFTAGPEMPNPTNPIEIQSVGDKTKNWFDENNATFLNGWINDLGVFTSNSSYKTLNYYHVKPSTTYTLSYIKTFNSYYDRVCEYSSNTEDTFVKVTKADNKAVPLEQRVSITFTTSDTTNYIRLNMASTDPEHYQDVNIQIEEGSTPTDYEPYGYKIPVNVKHNIFDKNNTIRYRAYININNNFVGGTSDSSSVAIACLPNKTYKIIKYIDTAIYRACYINDEMPELGKTTPAYNVQSETNDEIIVTTGENAKYVVIQCANALYESFIDTLEVIDEETTTNIYLDEPLRKIGNYTDYIDYENQKVVKNVRELVITGDEEWEYISNIARFTIANSQLSDTGIGYSDQLCNYFKCASITTGSTTKGASVYYSSSLNGTFFRVRDDVLTSSTVAKNFFKDLYNSGNPCKIYYQSVAPTEESIELPDILLNKGTNVVDVETSVTPSNLWLKYKGKE